MGLFNRLVREVTETSSRSTTTTTMASVDTATTEINPEDDDTYVQMVVMSTFVSLFAGLYYLSKSRPLRGERRVSLQALNDATVFKEVFLAYLSASVLEPITSIAGAEELIPSNALKEFLTIISICTWIHLLTDSFTFEDVTSYFAYHYDIRREFNEDPGKYPWFQLKDRVAESKKEKATLSGNFRRAAALWFLIGSIIMAWLPGLVTQQDVIHAYVIIFMWIIMHHKCRAATAWETNYLVSLFFPSTALLPMEYCLPLMDVADTVSDLDFLVRYRVFVKNRIGLDLTIVT